MRGVNIGDMAVETAQTRLGQVVAGLLLLGVLRPLVRRSRRA
jgi:hypothetical protein